MRVPVVAWLKRHDACALIPVWTFFAPNPGTRDVRLLWRERYSDGTLSAWRETTPPDPGPWKGLWNPHKRARKAVTDACPSVLRRVGSHPDSPLTVISVPYLMITNHVCSLPGAPMARARQFLIAYTEGDDADVLAFPRIQFISHWHALDPEAQPVAARPARRPAVVPAGRVST
jgi:hypothetical protein